jgi:hypothetical protein
MLAISASMSPMGYWRAGFANPASRQLLFQRPYTVNLHIETLLLLPDQIG